MVTLVYILKYLYIMNYVKIIEYELKMKIICNLLIIYVFIM